jgi:YHS domain-containing protein
LLFLIVLAGVADPGSTATELEVRTMQTKDPVCNMRIESEKAAFKEEFKGTTYYFCSAKCFADFKANPEKYVEAKTKEA